MDGEVNNPTARITQDVKRDRQHETDADETEADETTQTNTDRHNRRRRTQTDTTDAGDRHKEGEAKHRE